MKINLGGPGLRSHSVNLLDTQGPVVQRPISANPGLNFNMGFFSSFLKALSLITLSILFRAYNHKFVFKKNYADCAF